MFESCFGDVFGDALGIWGMCWDVWAAFGVVLGMFGDVWECLGTKMNKNGKTTGKRTPAAACVQERKIF